MISKRAYHSCEISASSQQPQYVIIVVIIVIAILFAELQNSV